MLTLKNSEVSEVSEVQATIHAGSADTPAGFTEVSEVSNRVSSIIPGEKDRPKFVVIDDWLKEGSTNYRPGVWRFDVKQGRGEAPPTLTQQWICSPLHIDAVTTDAQGGNYGRLIRIRSTLGKWTTWAMPMNMLRGDCSDLRGELLGMGVEIDPFTRNQLAVYLQDKAPKRRIQCALQTGWASTELRRSFCLIPLSGRKRRAWPISPVNAAQRNTPRGATWPDGRQAPPHWPWAIRCWCWPCRQRLPGRCWRAAMPKAAAFT